MADQPTSPVGSEDNVQVIASINPAAAPPAMPPVAPPAAEQPQTSPAVLPREEPARATPIPAETAPPPSASNLPPVTSTIAKQAAELGLSVVDAERDGQQLFLVVEGENVEDVNGAEGRKLAYDARFHYGFDNAGVESHGGPEPVGDAGPSRRYRQTWKLTRSML
jgi:hypothetical protein